MDTPDTFMTDPHRRKSRLGPDLGHEWGWMPGCQFARQLRVLKRIAPYVRYLNRQIRPGIGMDHKCYKDFRLETGETLSWNVEIDENRRVADVKDPTIERYLYSTDDPRPGSEHRMSKYAYREPTAQELQDYFAGLDDITLSRADALISQIPEGRFSFWSKRYWITDEGVFTRTDFGREKLVLPICEAREIVEWSFTFLECFFHYEFVQANVPGFVVENDNDRVFDGRALVNQNDRVFAGCALVNQFDPRTFYNYPNLLDQLACRMNRLASESGFSLLGHLLPYPSSADIKRIVKEGFESRLKGTIGIVEEAVPSRRVRRGDLFDY